MLSAKIALAIDYCLSQKKLILHGPKKMRLNALSFFITFCSVQGMLIKVVLFIAHTHNPSFIVSIGSERSTHCAHDSPPCTLTIYLIVIFHIGNLLILDVRFST